jgi:hypothetical protein
MARLQSLAELLERAMERERERERETKKHGKCMDMYTASGKLWKCMGMHIYIYVCVCEM